MGRKYLGSRGADMGAKVSWLHLSDFHVGMDQYGQRKLFREICSHIKDRIDRGHHPNFVFVTGDLANKGLEAEYKEFIDEFLMPMTDALGPSWSVNYTVFLAIMT
jgi:3',5'-cyclic AMP phosphodiesterase CpdA